jgi:hypothetical protein
MRNKNNNVLDQSQELAVLAYRREVISQWPNSARKDAALASVASREASIRAGR